MGSRLGQPQALGIQDCCLHSALARSRCRMTWLLQVTFGM